MQQTLCLVTEDFNRDATLDRDALKKCWLPVFGRLPFVHFASLAELPGVEPNTTSLALELAIDDGIEPREAVSRLIDAAPNELWDLYKTPADSELGPTGRAALEKRLLSLADRARAAGGFVGMRDRGAVQVRAEQRWFFIARNKLRAIRAQTLANPDPPDASELVNRLLLALRDDPAWAAMNSPPPRSWWCRPRPDLLQLLMALVWVVLPLPLLACIVALLGRFTELALGQLPGAEAVFTVGGVFAIVLLCTVLALGLVLSRTIAVSVALVVASLAGILVFYVALVVAYLNLPGHPEWRPMANGIGVLLLVLAGLWVLIRTLRNETWTLWVGRGVAVAGAFVAGYLLGAVWNNSLERPHFPSGPAVPYALSWLGAALLIWRSSAARWFFALSLPLILLLLSLLLLLPLTPLAPMAPASSAVWLEIKLSRHSALGALALADLLLLLGVLGSLAALLVLRTPRRPLGLPLLGALAVLLIGHLLVAALVQRLLGPAPDLLLQLFKVETYLWVLVGLLLTGLFVLVLVVLARTLLPALQRSVAKADRPIENHTFPPLRLNGQIVTNEAEQVGGANHMISLTDVRGRRWGPHWMMTWLWLHVVGASGMLFYTRGPLGMAKGIQFAHWHLVQQGRRLLFVSNYDGDFGGYLDEFIDGASQGINLIWRWTTLKPRAGVATARDFPPTRLLALSGCHNEQAFKAYARASMVPHLVRYRAYDSSCQDIERCTRLREALTGERTPQNDNQVLRLLGS